jgi:hypothetical protein
MTFAGEEQTRADLAGAHQVARCDGLAEGTWNQLSAALEEARRHFEALRGMLGARGGLGVG